MYASNVVSIDGDCSGSCLLGLVLLGLLYIFCFLMIRRPPSSTRTDTLFPTRRSSDLSLDGDVATHTANRTATPAATKRFRTNLETVIARYGPDKVSALPTLDPLAPPDIDALIDSYADRKSTRLNSSH